MNPDSSINTDNINESDVKKAISTIHALRSAFGDEKNNLHYLARVLEVMYGVTYNLDSDDIDNLEHVINAIDKSDTRRLDPSHVDKKVAQGNSLLSKVDAYEYHGRFNDIPVVSYRQREDSSQ